VSAVSAQRPAWCALHTRHQHERSVASVLAGKGIEIFLPTYQAIHRWNDRNKQLTLPLFPGYLFFRYELERRLHVLSTPGINGIVNSGGVPAPIPEHEISGIRRMVESSLVLEPHPFLAEGDLVRIKAGPLAGLEGIVSRKKDAVRLVLSVTMLGRSAAAEVDGSMIERLGPARPVSPEPPRARAARCGGSF
jgi:transcription antitermination factor NusG